MPISKIRKFIKDNLMITTINSSEADKNYAKGYNDCLDELKELIDELEKKEVK